MARSAWPFNLLFELEQINQSRKTDQLVAIRKHLGEAVYQEILLYDPAADPCGDRHPPSALSDPGGFFWQPGWGTIPVALLEGARAALVKLQEKKKQKKADAAADADAYDADAYEADAYEADGEAAAAQAGAAGPSSPSQALGGGGSGCCWRFWWCCWWFWWCWWCCCWCCWRCCCCCCGGGPADGPADGRGPDRARGQRGLAAPSSGGQL
jgi:hypothetical protein